MAYQSAQPIFRALGIAGGQEAAVLDKLARKMESGELCSPTGEPLRLQQIIRVLRDSQ